MNSIEELELAYGATCWDDINEVRDFGSKAIALCRSLQQQLAERDAEVARLREALAQCKQDALEVSALTCEGTALQYRRSRYITKSGVAYKCAAAIRKLAAIAQGEGEK